ncbi:uncharacterized protein [Euphorbia lathyris]|uniref:uncharacterized protein n=1 Tax=Euphorbia lathyris TaxID=212925 RepID=UPI003313CF46
MKGYSKMKSPSDSRSMEVSEQKRSSKKSDKESSKFQESKEVQKMKNNDEISKNTRDDSFFGFEQQQEEEEKEEHGKEIRNEEILTSSKSKSKSKAKMKRNSSVSSSGSHSLHSAVKKAFSIRRSTSVSDRYCRIHDQSSALPSPTTHHYDVEADADLDTDADGFVNKSRSVKKKNTRGRILKACKKLIGKR